MKDPCPRCTRGGVCRTPACGRLKPEYQTYLKLAVSVTTDTPVAHSLMSDQDVSAFVDTLARIATTYRDSQQMHCRLSHVVLDTLTSHNLKA